MNELLIPEDLLQLEKLKFVYSFGRLTKIPCRCALNIIDNVTFTFTRPFSLTFISSIK